MLGLLMRRRGWPVPWVALALGTLGCGVTRSGTAVPAGNSGAAGVPPTESGLQADIAPIRALVFAEPFLWVGSDRGLRRIRLPAGVAEWVRPQGGIGGVGVSALAVDRAGQLLVATEAGIGRLTGGSGAGGGGSIGFLPVAPLPAATQLVAVTSGASGEDALWAGTANGLFFLQRGSARPVEEARGAAITSLDLDADGRSVWAGVRGRGIVRAEAGKVTVAVGPESGERLDFADSLGTALLANGTRIAAGRGVRGDARIVLLRLGGAEVLVAQPEVALSALIPRPGAPLLLAGSGAGAQSYTLTLAERGEVMDDGIRFVPARKSLGASRLVARPHGQAAPPDVTVGAIGGAGPDAYAYVGTRALGVARVGGGEAGPGGAGGARSVRAPDYLPVGELALDARALSVACLERERCVFATGTGPGWIWDGRARNIRPIPDGAIGGGLMALAGDGATTVYFVAAVGGKALAIARLSSDGARWDHLLTLPVKVEGVPIVTFAVLSPDGNLWMTVRDRVASGQEFGRGVIEVQLPAGRSIHHRPTTAKEVSAPDAIPVGGDVTSIRFQRGTAGEPDTIWFCSSAGVMRFFAGQLSQWGENEGLDSETCADLEIAPDGTVWVATPAGMARFDGKRWLRLGSAGTSAVGAGGPQASRWPVDREGEAVAARALVVWGRELWAGTPIGVWPLAVAGSRGQAPLARSSGLLDDDVVDLVADRFGRLWVLGHLGLTVTVR